MGQDAFSERGRLEDDTRAGSDSKSLPTRSDATIENSSVVKSGGVSGSLVNGVICGTIDDSMKPRGKTQEILLSELTAEERTAVFRLDVANNSDDLKLFAKLLKYFRGKQHIEEIMYYENISRSQILIILDKFRDVLVTSLHPDPVTSVFLD